MNIGGGDHLARHRQKPREGPLKGQENTQKNTHTHTQKKNQRYFITFIPVLKTTALATTVDFIQKHRVTHL